VVLYQKRCCFDTGPDFVRLVGIKRAVYEAMVEAVESQHRDFGRPAKLCLGD